MNGAILGPVAHVRFTKDDYYQLPEDWCGELIGGTLLMAPSPDPSHEELAVELIVRLYALLGRGRVLGSPVDIEIDDENVIQPDVLVLPEGTRRGKRPWKIPGPVWVAEIHSPSTRVRDRGVKLRLYTRNGVREAWLVDQVLETIEVHDLVAGTHTVFAAGETARSDAIPGFAVDVASFFAR